MGGRQVEAVEQVEDLRERSQAIGVGVEQDRAIEGRSEDVPRLEQVVVFGCDDLDPIEAVGLDPIVGDDRDRNPEPRRRPNARTREPLGGRERSEVRKRTYRTPPRSPAGMPSSGSGVGDVSGGALSCNEPPPSGALR